MSRRVRPSVAGAGPARGPDARGRPACGRARRVGNLTALRELALLWLADKVDEQLDRYRAAHGIEGTWEARERVVVAVTGGPEGETLIRRAARIAERSKGADLLAVHVVRSDGLASTDPGHLAQQRILVEDLGGTYHQVVGDDIPTALLDFARGVNATQLVLGASRRGRIAQLFSAGVGVTTAAKSGHIDVHLVTHEEAKKGRAGTRPRAGLTGRRRAIGFALTAVGLPALCLVLANLRGDLKLTSDILPFLAAVAGIALVGCLYPAVAGAVLGFLLLDYYFTPPLHRWTVADRDNVVALIVVAVAVAVAVELTARRSSQAAQARAEATTLSTIAGGVLRGERPIQALLQQMREAFGQASVTLLERRPDAAPEPDQERDANVWRIAASVGDQPCTAPDDGDADIPIGDDIRVVLRGHPLAAAEQRVVDAFAAQAAIALRQERLTAQGAAGDALAERDRTRTILLTAVSHELRAPLASAKTAASGLRSQVVIVDDTNHDELLATIEESLDTLDRLAENLLEMSRLQAGALTMNLEPVNAAPVVAQALADLGPHGKDVIVHIPDELPEILADAALLERILVNLVGNALRHSPPSEPPRVAASAHTDRVEIRIIDTGPGIPAAERDRAFQPFQHRADRDAKSGLGLALSLGLAEAMNGTLEPDDTPGGGLTMTLALPRAEPQT